MSAYKLTADSNMVRRTSDGAFIPNDPWNPDWAAYQTWLLVKGNAPDLADPEPAPAAPPISAEQLAALLVQKTIITAADVSAATAAIAAPNQSSEG